MYIKDPFPHAKYLDFMVILILHWIIPNVFTRTTIPYWCFLQAGHNIYSLLQIMYSNIHGLLGVNLNAFANAKILLADQGYDHNNTD